MKCIYFVSMMVILVSQHLNADEFKTKKEKLIMEYLDTYQGLKDEILIESNNLFKKFYGVDKKDVPIYITKIIDELSLLAKTGLSPKDSRALEEKIVNKFNKCFASEGVLPNVEKFEIDKLVLEKIDFADKVFRYYITCTKQNESYKDLEDCYIEGVDHVIRDLEAFRNKTTELAALDESEINKRLMIHACKQAALKFVKNPSELHNQKKGDFSGRDDWFDKEEL